MKLESVLKVLGYRSLNSDWAIWIHEDGAFIAAHVDDMAAATYTDQDLDTLHRGITDFFGIKDLGTISRYLNIPYKYDSVNFIFLLSQSDYIHKLLTECDMLNAFDVQTPVLESERKRWDLDETEFLNTQLPRKYQALIGSLLYVMHGTRLDIAYPVITLSQYTSKLRVVHWHSLKRILRYLKGTMTATSILNWHGRRLGSRKPGLWARHGHETSRDKTGPRSRDVSWSSRRVPGRPGTFCKESRDVLSRSPGIKSRDISSRAQVYCGL